MIVCAHLPRFELVVAAGGPRALAGRALAVAPVASAQATVGQRVGEVSGAAEARGVAAGMALGEALARCPDLVLVPGDPVRVAESWETAVRALEGIGAAVEPARPGLAYFDADGLRGLHGSYAATLAAARRALDRPVRLGAAPTRFGALAAALAARSRRPLTLDGAEGARWLAGRPVSLLGYRPETAALVEPLGRLGVHTLGELARLTRAEVADRFGAPGTIAHGLAHGEDGPLRPRHPLESVQEWMDVGDAGSGMALRRVLGVLVGRLLARPERRERTLRAATLSARLVAGGGWRERVVFRQALCDQERIWLALSLRLQTLPAPAVTLGLAVDGFGPPLGEQGALFDRERARPALRVARLREAVAQMRAVAGADAALRAVCVDPGSRVPERRIVLAPIPE